jgi:hypothetical protein
VVWFHEKKMAKGKADEKRTIRSCKDSNYTLHIQLHGLRKHFNFHSLPFWPHYTMLPGRALITDHHS